MKKIILSLMCLAGVFSANAQEETPTEEIKKSWTRGGNLGLTFSQSAFNKEWNSTVGGINNIAANVLVNYDFNYAKGDYVWDNKFIFDYGVNKIGDSSNDFIKSNDRIELNSIAGKKATNNWYYSTYFNLKTQADAGINNVGIRNSQFFSPAYFQLGLGMLWKKSDNLSVNISPAASKLILVDSKFAGSFGTDAGKTSRYELGASLRGYYKTTLMENVTVENILGLYSNYLEDAQNVDVDYTMNLIMKVNKYISANLTLQAVYDDNANPKGFQVREAFGVGLNYAF